MCCDDVKKSPFVAAVCGVKNSGKTTLLIRLVKLLSDRGIRTAVIKHDGHDFECDVPGTDSYRIREAGAYGTAVFSKYRSFVYKENCRETIEEMIDRFPEADLILVEGMKDSTYPKIEVVRREISDKPVSNPEGRFLIVSDWESGHFRGEQSAGLDEAEKILKILLEKAKIE
ncbi:molybdopterin-guanine dinucleotide biosynthesis protein B [bacterium]|uniref:molybdopterin-guanine dinucleotide biosynthesis protein B n=1 Tax=Lachnospiraceae TaxID=186803 RepID=UPI002A282118|nr:molybdopterin-guanine dinucleotide biosynthesis protein B [Blautia sp.]MCI6092883.1 molybdopterin-guanine dinucleotide biosynthesis protein B [bacterium]MDY4502965.1 molybdopterin-guanine dinucleotide biosynthesis protein B [Bariatricus sp.]MDD6516177.1 molybdopterin-guanine dinucleotide biosynthesis protein B [bacterium]MDD7142386.1 molybdopterin-guanine dinucleotide biosynthesis protein B [bacterium]MDY4115405.1 molybdopterin-guanine dinucleotide biosynthesis protein B [Blautia sp.]